MPRFDPPGEAPLVAVLGGGQLGRMLALAGIPLGLRFRFLDPNPEAPAAGLGPVVIAPLDDADALAELTAGATVVTYEWEGVPAEQARRVGPELAVRPGPEALARAQDRIEEKAAFERLGIPVPRFAAVDDAGDLRQAIDAIGLPAVLKTRRGGYDGKGQVVLGTALDAEGAWAALDGEPAILEELVNFERELSVLAVRGLDGEIRAWPLVQNEHRDGILLVSRAPAPGLTPALQSQAEEIARRVLEDLDYVGVLAVELFQRDGELLANELAPRVHNSGHWTIEGAETSQFEQHLRAILGWPLGSCAARGYSVMVNCLGAMPAREAVLTVEGAHLHDYAKAPRPGRKLGHVTITAPSPEELERRAGMLQSDRVPG